MAGESLPISNVFERSNKVSSVAEKYSYIYYDRFTIAVATLEHTLFQTPKGQAGKTLADTNMILAGQIPKGKSIKIPAIQIQYQNFSALTAAKALAVAEMLAETTFEFIVDSKENYITENFQGLFGSPLFAVSTDGTCQLASSKIVGYYPLNEPIQLSEQDAFRARVVHHVAPDALLVGDKIRVGYPCYQWRTL